MKKKIKLSGYNIKKIAFVSMILDHFALIIFGNAMIVGININNLVSLNNKIIYYAYYFFRAIGRISFPLFAFILVEGSRFTTNKYKYLLRMICFALIAEVAYDWAISNVIISFNSQNIFFLFSLGLVVIYVIELINGINIFGVNIILKISICILGMMIAEYGNFDYGYVGMLVIYTFYFVEDKIVSMIISCIILCIFLHFEFFSFLALIPICFYDGTKGNYKKYVFYIAYPVQFLIIKLIYVAISILPILTRR